MDGFFVEVILNEFCGEKGGVIFGEFLVEKFCKSIKCMGELMLFNFIFF